MQHTFEANPQAYLLRVMGLTGACWAAALLGILIPGIAGDGGFSLMGFLMGAVILFVGLKLKPRRLALAIANQEVRIKDERDRILYSVPAKRVGSITTDRYGHILGMHTAHILINEHGRQKAKNFGPVLIDSLPGDLFEQIDDALR